MLETAPNAELLRALGRLVRGLSALFWSLPVTLIICVQSAETQMLRPFNVLPPLLATAWIWYGLWQLGHFQKQERVWIRALDQTKLIGLVDVGLSPFIFWWSQRPDQPFYEAVVGLLSVTGILFLAALNLALSRLAAMLPDENLREETKHFTMLNRILLVGILFLGAAIDYVLQHPATMTLPVIFEVAVARGGLWLVVFLILLPLAMTMALIWKIKETIMDSVFGAAGK
jgi:hypothetical protein